MKPSERWAELRNKAGFYSNQRLERALNVSPGQIWRWTRANHNPRLETLADLGKLLGVSMDEISALLHGMRAEFEAKNREQSA